MHFSTFQPNAASVNSLKFSEVFCHIQIETSSGCRVYFALYFVWYFATSSSVFRTDRQSDMDLVLSYFRAFFDRSRASLLGSLSSGVRSSKRRQAPLALTFRSQQKYLEIILKSTILDLYYK